MNNTLFKNGEKLAVFCDISAIEQATGPGSRTEQLELLLESSAEGRSLHRATAYMSRNQSSPPDDEPARSIREAGFHVVELDGPGISVALAVEMVMAADEAEILIVVTGDSTLKPAIAAARAKGARVEVVICPGQSSAALAAAADSSITIENLVGSAGGRRPRRSERPAPDPRRSRSSQAPASESRGGRPSRPRSSADGPGRSRPGEGSSRRRQELQRQEWPTPPPPSPEEMGINPANRVRPRSVGRPSARPPAREPSPEPTREPSPEPTREPPRVPPREAPTSPPSFTVLDGESLSKPADEEAGGGDRGSSR